MIRQQGFVAKVLQNLSKRIFQLVNRDSITYRKISRRNDLRELGTHYGGWVIPTNLLNSDSICYCVGCGEDISFDISLIEEFDCHVFGFDPTPRAIKYVKEHTVNYEKYHFLEIGLWEKEEILKFYQPANPNHVSQIMVIH